MDKDIEELQREKETVATEFSDEIEERKLDLSEAETKLKVALTKIDDKILHHHKTDAGARTEVLRLMNQYFTLKLRGETSAQDAGVVYDFIKFAADAPQLPKYKVAFLFICLNPTYWQYAPQVIEGAKKHFVPWHNVDYFMWTDIPKDPNEIGQTMTQMFHETGENLEDATVQNSVNTVINGVINLTQMKEMNMIKTEPVGWPYPTLMRYHKFLDMEEKLKDYDYVFYCDIDMKFVDLVGDEIFGDKLTAARHPMYALKSNFLFPTDPNPQSKAYIKYPGVLDLPNKKFDHLYAAGGFQGGKTENFIKAMKVLRDNIDIDSKNGYIARWNEESHWNRYLYDNPDEISVVLSPSYVYPDSLIKEYYEPIWGKSYAPRLLTLTKKFTTSKDAADAIRTTLDQMKQLR